MQTCGTRFRLLHGTVLLDVNVLVRLPAGWLLEDRLLKLPSGSSSICEVLLRLQCQTLFELSKGMKYAGNSIHSESRQEKNIPTIFAKEVT